MIKSSMRVLLYIRVVIVVFYSYIVSGMVQCTSPGITYNTNRAGIKIKHKILSTGQAMFRPILSK